MLLQRIAKKVLSEERCQAKMAKEKTEMLSVKVDTENLIAILEPVGSLSEGGFQSAAKTVDPLIEKSERLNGIIIYTK